MPSTIWHWNFLSFWNWNDFVGLCRGFLFQHQLITRTALLSQYRDHFCWKNLAYHKLPCICGFYLFYLDNSLSDVYDVTFIYLPIIRSAYCHRLPYIEASRHHSSQFEFYLFIFDTRHHSRCSLSHAALHWVSTVSRQPVGVLIILYFDTHLRRLWCGINLSAHHSLGISSHDRQKLAQIESLTASKKLIWFILFCF